MRRRALLKGGKKDYFAMVVTGDGSIYWRGLTDDNILYYSKDNGATWTAINKASISVTAGDRILWKGTLTAKVLEGPGRFSGYPRPKYSIEGNIMSLLYGDDFEDKTSLSGKYDAFSKLFYENESVTSAENLLLPATTLANRCYNSMFWQCTELTTPPLLPATTLASSCYLSMFYGCSSLTTAPELPATTLASWCYINMFDGCASLTTAPKLPATTLTDSCYSNMFEYCTSLTTAPELPATTLANSCYKNMFTGCYQLTTPPLLPATTLAERCYEQMFILCSKLTTAPELPATTLISQCYCAMFSGCTNLNSIKCLATNISASDCTSGWVKRVASSGTFIKKASMSSWTTGVDGIPEGWTVQDA